MSARDELEQAISDALSRPMPGEKAMDRLRVADRLIAAGYRKPRTITTAEELDGLAFEAVVRDAEGHVLERWGGPGENLWVTVMVNSFIHHTDIALPATVLYEPTP